jgi:hypothetical protein
MAKNVKLSKVAQAHEKLAETRRVLREAGCMSMELVEDKAGIVAERFVRPGDGKSIVVWATPHWYDAYAPITSENNLSAYLLGIDEFARAGEKKVQTKPVYGSIQSEG